MKRLLVVVFVICGGLFVILVGGAIVFVLRLLGCD